MRFKQHIINETVTPSNWKKLQEILERDCMPYIKQLRGVKSLLVRGSKKLTTFYDEVIQRQDRRPLLINPDLSDILDDWTLKNWGFRSRSQSAFATNRLNAAKRYGNVYMIFPIGKFKYACNDNVNDLYGAYDSYEFRVIDMADKMTSKNDMGDDRDPKEPHQKVFDEEILPHLKAYTVNTGLNRYLGDKSWEKTDFSECIVNCKSYYLINMEWSDTLLVWYTKRYWNKK